MIIYLTIQNLQNINIAQLRYWLIDNCKKWVLKANTLNVNVMFTTNYERRMDNIIKGLKDYLKSKDKFWVFFLKSKFNIFKANQVNTNEDFLDKLKSKFFDKNIANSTINEDFDFSKIELKGYTKKTLISLLKKRDVSIDSEQPIIKINMTEPSKKISDDLSKKTCNFCLKIFSSQSNAIRHIKTCKKREIEHTNNLNIEPKNIELNTEPKNTELKETVKNIISNTVENIINDKIDTKMNDITKILKEIRSNQNQSSIINNTTNNNTNNTTNNVNIQINNSTTKKEKLNKHLQHEMIDIITFLDNYKNDPRFQMTKDESQVLFENSETMGINSYSEGLYTCIKKKYALLLNSLFGKNKNYYDIILPFLCNDINLRNHYELTTNGWEIKKNTDNIKKILTISDDQIFKHHNKFVCYTSKRGKDHVINFFLRKSDYTEIEKILDAKEKQASITSS